LWPDRRENDNDGFGILNHRSRSVRAALSHFWHCRKGATAIEYAMIAGLVALVLLPGLIWLRDWQAKVAEKLNAGLNFTDGSSVVTQSDFREPRRDVRDHQ
jgi:Flp pilus assembly pilin Flp